MMRNQPYKKQAQKSEYDSKLVDIARVTRVSAGGKRFSFRAVVIMGNKKGKIGIGVAKGVDVAQALDKANRKAEKNMIIVPILEGTIPHEVEAKFGASRVLLKPQKKGRGLVAGGVVRVMCEKAGIHDISAKFISKTHNKLNNAMAAMKALKLLRARKPKQEPINNNSSGAESGLASEDKQKTITPPSSALGELRRAGNNQTNPPLAENI
ncbi:MAG: 30S ribosomal protein S5 [Candidatus Wildermuthbacteria bacterium]|nr:30S ribosomal protein S5 [Candidatus Wildermuthbacteria bacterium]